MTSVPTAPDGLMDAFWAYESALMSDDVAVLDALFADAADTLRGDGSGLLVGHDQIAAFRSARRGAPQRTVVETHLQVVDNDHALVVAVTELSRGGRGQQTQLWARTPGRREYGGWQVTAAHVAVPGPALDTRIWRLVGDPLVPGADPDAALSGESVAVKDLFAVAGQRIGAGNPEWLSHAEVEPEHAAAVAALLDAGASVRGIARTDEFAYSLAGANAHYGTPPNPKAPYRLPGGSSSGSASAVSLGHATIGLGTDTGGSIRVPAAYQGLFGIRTSHDLVPRTGLLPLAPRFDAVGWMTRSAFLLQAVGDVLLPSADVRELTEFVEVPSLTALADPDVAEAVSGWGPERSVEDWDLDELIQWRSAMQTYQAFQAWQVHGEWLGPRLDSLAADVRGRFENASRVGAEEAVEALTVVDSARGRIVELVGDRVLVLPSASSVAPRVGAAAEQVQRTRDATMTLTCLAGIAGLPAMSLPLATAAGLPCGVCLVAAPGRDRDLLALRTQGSLGRFVPVDSRQRNAP
ncbi:MAG: AtzH-like domain-containing protein [Nocardioides sp.]